MKGGGFRINNHSSDFGLLIDGVTKRFGEFTAVDGVSLSVRRGEFFTLLGPSGCGKTTLLRCVAGFCQPESGAIYAGDARIDSLPPHRRDIGMVFQNYAVFPHLNVHNNVAYGLRARRLPAGELAVRVDEALRLVRLTEFQRRMPAELSGGQQQRVALARALVIRPRLLLMDEPLSNLDAKLRTEMRSEIRQLQRQLEITTLYVTHDQEEALAVSDRIAVMNSGRIRQTGNGADIYTAPADEFVAQFVGLTNVFSGMVGPGCIDLGGGVFIGLPEHCRAYEGQTVRLSIRPECMWIHRQELAGRLEHTEDTEGIAFQFQARLHELTYLGAVARHEVVLENGTTIIVQEHDPDPRFLPEKGQAVSVRFKPHRLVVLSKQEESDIESRR